MLQVCNVIDVTEMCRQTHADVRWREAAESAFSKLADYMSILNADRSLYDALEFVKEQALRHEVSLDEADLRLIALLKAEFERDGIHLADSLRDEVRELQNTVTEIEGTFSRNLVRNRDMFSVENVTDVTDLVGTNVLSSVGAAVGADSSGEVTSLSLPKNDSGLLQTLLKYSTSPSLRKEIYMAHATAIPENIPVLDDLVRTRHALASRQGFESFTHRYLADKMVGSPSTVKTFLAQYLQDNNDQFRKDMDALSSSKFKVEGNRHLEPWDVAFYTELSKARIADPHPTVSQYLSLEGCIRAMEELVLRLFGIEMTPEPMDETERWDMSVDQPTRECTLRKYNFTDTDGQPLGVMYLDLHPRENKFGHAAHFTLRCGCDSDSDEYQLPIVALVCNLSSNTDLHHSSVETLFHEFGHVLHSLLSRTKYHHMFGTRVAIDFVETPSHLLETFVWDPVFLKILAVDRRTGEPIPDNLVEQLRATKSSFAAVERQNQIIYSMFDQALFGYPTKESSSSLIERLLSENEIPFAPGTHWHSRFGHLVSYGGGYYSYLHCQKFASSLWNHLFQGKSLSRESGEKLWRGILIHGGQKDPQQLLDSTLNS